MGVELQPQPGLLSRTIAEFVEHSLNDSPRQGTQDVTPSRTPAAGWLRLVGLASMCGFSITAIGQWNAAQAGMLLVG